MLIQSHPGIFSDLFLIFYLINHLSFVAQPRATFCIEEDEAGALEREEGTYHEDKVINQGRGAEGWWSTLLRG